MEDALARSRMLFGQENLEKLSRAKVAVFGIGGVGGYAAEALARCGVGSLVLVDHDTVSMSNLNRQIIALHSTLGRYKADVMAARIRDIDPGIHVEERRCFYLPQNADEFDFSEYSYVVDAVDTITAKLEIIQRARRSGVPVICSMGAGNKSDPTLFRVADIFETSVCPLARVMRRECRKRGIRDLKVVYSPEEPKRPFRDETGEKPDQGAVSNLYESGDGYESAADCTKDAVSGGGRTVEDAFRERRRDIPGSCVFAPAAAGLAIAWAVAEDLMKGETVCLN